MKFALPAAAAVLALMIFIPGEALAGLGEPLAADSLGAGERKVIIEKLARNPAFQPAGEEKAGIVLERLPDGELKLLTQNVDAIVSGGSNLMWAAYLGWFYISLFIMLIVFLVLALFGVGPISD